MNKLAVFITGCLFMLLLLFSFQPLPKSATQIDLSTQEEINGNIRRIDYIDGNGAITTHLSNRYATKIQKLDENGNPVEEYYMDADENPVMLSSGYVTVKQVYNDQRQVAEVYYYDTEEQPIALSSGQYGEYREYNSDGKNYISTCIDAAGNPMENNKGYSTVQCASMKMARMSVQCPLMLMDVNCSIWNTCFRNSPGL